MGERVPIDNLGIGNTILEFCNRNISERKISIQLMILAEIISKHEKRILDKLNI